jgi:hypothetical protein
VAHGWHRFGGRLVKAGLKYVYLTEFSQWCDAHRDCHFNDYYNARTDYNLRLDLYDKLATLKDLARQPIDYLEFGVASGHFPGLVDPQEPQPRFEVCRIRHVYRPA